MNKKTIIFVLIILLFINTIFWLSVGNRFNRYKAIQKEYEDITPTSIFLGQVSEKRLKEYSELLSEVTKGFVGRIIFKLRDSNPHAHFTILAITDIVLIAILQELGKMKNGILVCLIISIIIGLYEFYWFLFVRNSVSGLILAILSFVISYICFYLWSKK